MNLRSMLLILIAVPIAGSLALAQWDALEEARLLPDPGVSAFGATVGIDGSTAVVGAPQPSSGNVGRAYVYVRNAGAWLETAEITGHDSTSGDQFAWSVAIDGDTIVAGAPSDDSHGVPSGGSAYVFVRQGHAWTEQAKLQADDPTFQDAFGYSVSISEDTIVVGARGAYVDGEDVYCQWWYRDPMAASFTGLSDALRFRIQP